MTTIIEAAKTLLSVCDGARTKDDQGYNGGDSQFVRNVLSHDFITYKQENALYHTLLKYKKQLSGFGINYDTLVFEKIPETPFSKPKNITNNFETWSAVIMPFGKYKGMGLDEIAKIDIGYLKWASMNLDPGFIQECAIKLINGEEYKYEKPKLKLSIKDNFVIIQSPFELKDEIKTLPERKWDPDSKVWYSPISTLRQIVNHFPDAILDDKAKEILKNMNDIAFLSDKASTDKNIEFGNLKLLPFQSVGVQFIEKNGGNALVADEMGCIDGETLISLNRNKKGFKLKLSDLYLRFNNLDVRKRYKWNNKNITYARSLMPDGTIRLNKILNVIYSGIKKTIKIYTNNKELILTPDHEILTPSGFIIAEKLKIGDTILTNGIDICPNCGTTKNIITYKNAKFLGYCKECMYRQFRENHLKYKKTIKEDSIYILGGLQYHPYNTTGGIAEHRLIYEAYINNLTLNEWLKKLKNNKIENCKFLSPFIDIHHINGNSKDNNIKNLKAVTRSQHHIIHNKYKNFKLTIPKEDIIIKIESVGKRDVYDIIMDEPSRNFIANGIIVHNCGKTIQALAYIRRNNDRPVLIVCPASLKINWLNECKKWLDSSEKISIIGKTIEPNQTIYIINYDIVSKFLMQLLNMNFKVLVLDESHFVKNHKAQRTKSIVELSKVISKKILLTGTPVLNRPNELWQQLNIIDSIKFEKFTTFAFRYCGAENSGYGWTFSGATHIDELNDRLKTIMVRRLKSQVLAELPDKRKQSIILPLSNREEYNEAHGDYIKYLKTISLEDAAKAQDAEHLVRIAGLKKLSIKGKMKTIIDWIDNFLESDQKLVLFAWHTEIIKQLVDNYKNIAVSLTGETSMEQRQFAVDNFQNNPNIKLFIGNMKAAGVGITLTSSSNVVFLEFPWTPSELIQAEDRLHRIGQKNAVNVYYLVGENTIDIEIIDLLREKSSIIDAVMDGKPLESSNILKELMRKLT